MSQQPDGRWSIKREVSIGDLIAFVTAMVAVVYAYSTLDTRIQILERENITLMKANIRQDDDTVALKKDLGDRLQRIDDKLDRLMWRNSATRGSYETGR